jgi:hypothetical protein
LQGYAQLRNDSQATVGSTVMNVGDAWVAAVIGDLELHPCRWLALTSATTLAGSRVISSGLEFPYLPRWTEILGAGLRPLAGQGGVSAGWELRASFRTATSYGTSAQSTASLPGYGLLDLELRGDIWRDHLSVILRAENITNRPIQLVSGYPLPGQVFSAEVTGRL